MKTAYLIHGTSLPTDDWFPWLKKMARQRLNCQLKIVALPNPFAPVPAQWDAACDRAIHTTDNVVIVAHSLGCIEALRFIEKHALTHVRLILVSGFDQPIYTYPQLDDFADHSFNYARDILPKVTESTVITAKDDRVVPTAYTQELARHLQADLVVESRGGHFLGADGYTQLPIVLETLAKYI